MSGYDVIAILGQSNAVGHEGGIDLNYDFTDARVTQWAFGGTYAQKQILAADPLQHNTTPTSNTIGFALLFAKQYADATGRPVLLVPCARGSTGFSGTPSWLSPSGAMLTDAISSINAAMSSNIDNRFAGVLWHQGETDVDASMSQASYATNVAALINHIRSNVTRAAQSWFIVGALRPEYVTIKGAAGTAINDALLDTPNSMKRTAAWQGVNLTTGAGDYTHYTAAEQRYNGLVAFRALAYALVNVNADDSGPLTLPIGSGSSGGSGTYQTATSFTSTGQDYGANGYTYVQRIEAAQIAATGDTIRITTKGGTSSEGASWDGMYIGHAAASGNAYNFEGAPTQVLFSGVGSATAPAGGTLVSNDVAFTLRNNAALLIAWHFSSSANDSAANATGITGYNMYYKNVSEAATVSKGAGYGAVSGVATLVVKVEAK